MYALESVKHTLDYKGWQDGYEKMCRITIGNYCQLWLSEFCRLNNIPHIKDNSSPYIPDNEDLSINGYSIDCKSSTVLNMPLQVSPHMLGQENIDAYVFFYTDKDISFIEPMGFISRVKYKEKATPINEGETIPGTKIKQRFGTSYFLKKEELVNFYSAINKMVENPKISK